MMEDEVESSIQAHTPPLLESFVVVIVAFWLRTVSHKDNGATTTVVPSNRTGISALGMGGGPDGGKSF